MMCHKSGLPPISIMGFGRTPVSSLIRVPKPPARMTAFTPSLSAPARCRLSEEFGACLANRPQPMSKAYRRFGLDRDPFLDTSDPHFFWEMPAVARAKAKLLSSIEESRGLTVVIGDPGSGKTSLSLADGISQKKWGSEVSRNGSLS